MWCCPGRPGYCRESCSRAEAARIGLNGLDFAVESFGNGIGNWVAQVGEDVFEMALDHFSHLDDGFEFAAGGPSEPVF